MTSASESNEKISTRKPNLTDDEDVTFFFFYDIVKQLILKRNYIGDASVLSSWLKALEQNKNKTVRNEYIKLMTLALQYPNPICPFKDPPPATIDPLENGVIEMAKKFIKKEGTATCIGDNEYDFEETYPTISTAISNNKCQYAAYQIIPNVGVQCYYAFSDEPMYNWSLSSKIKVPNSGPHATDIEWERAIAGIKLKLVTLSTDNLKMPNAQENVTVKDNVSEIKVSVSGKSRISRKKSDRLKESNDIPDVCNVMNIEQQNRNVSEVFVWNDASLLTGEMRLGAEECSDRKVYAQVKTQTELDKIAFNAYNKLYPGDFTINVVQSVINDIIPMETSVVTEEDDKKEERQQQQQQQPPHLRPSAQDGDSGGRCGGATKDQRACPVPKSCTTRQSAGHGSVKPREERLTAVDEESPSDHRRPRTTAKPIRRLSADFRAGNHDRRHESRDADAVPPANRPVPTDDCRVAFSERLRGRDGDDEFAGGGARPSVRGLKGQNCGACPTPPPPSFSRIDPTKFAGGGSAPQLCYERSAKSRAGGMSDDRSPSDT